MSNLTTANNVEYYKELGLIRMIMREYILIVRSDMIVFSRNLIGFERELSSALPIVFVF